MGVTMPSESSEIGYWICASFNHLRCFSLSAENIDEFEATRLAGQIGLLLNAVRGRGRLSISRLTSLAKAQRIGKTTLQNSIIPLIDSSVSERVKIIYRQGVPSGIEENIDSTEQLYDIVGILWESLEPSLIERGAIHVLKHTFVIPRIQTEELNLLSDDGFRDEEAEATLGIATSFKIIQSFESRKLEESVLFNPYVWRTNQEKIAPVLSHMQTSDKESVTDCIGQISVSQSQPADKFDEIRHQLDTAHAIGLVDIVEVNTSAGDRKEFLFTPHLTTHPDVSIYADDLLNDVRAVLACITYGEIYSRISRLGGHIREKTLNFLNKLLREKEAGDATAIGVDYNLLEERGIITVEETSTPPGGRYKMRLLRPEPIKIALKVINDSIKHISSRPLLVHTRTLDPASLFAGPEATRISNTPSLGKQPQHMKEARDHFLKTIRKEVF